MDDTRLFHMLMALRAQLVAQIATIDAALSALVGPPQEEENGGCRHPPEKRIDTSTQGGPAKFLCTTCSQEFEQTP